MILIPYASVQYLARELELQFPSSPSGGCGVRQRIAGSVREVWQKARGRVTRTAPAPTAGQPLVEEPPVSSITG